MKKGGKERGREAKRKFCEKGDGATYVHVLCMVYSYIFQYDMTN